jgi:hypothetical protein
VLGTIWSQVKRSKRELKWKRSLWAVLESTGRSGATHLTVQCAHDSPVHGPTERAAIGKKKHLLAINHRIVRAEYRTIWCTSRPTVSWHVGWSQRSTSAPDSLVPPTRRSGAPQKMKSANQAIHIRCTMQCPVCTGQSGAPANRRQSTPSKWSSNGS